MQRGTGNLKDKFWTNLVYSLPIKALGLPDIGKTNKDDMGTASSFSQAIAHLLLTLAQRKNTCHLVLGAGSIPSNKKK